MAFRDVLIDYLANLHSRGINSSTALGASYQASSGDPVAALVVLGFLVSTGLNAWYAYKEHKERNNHTDIYDETDKSDS